MSETTKVFMQALAAEIDEAINGPTLPKRTGFALLLFPFDGPEGARTNWVSNGKREDMIVALKEILARFEGQAEQRGNA